ncbi:hypothetical protein QBC46DRAFT_267321 [Diplogelasinospora grovesii]|uniref:Uncharacterized protein n=1 Tax=Diplogelasinospora grovesii TaxID=303347 RepID=A0AAN6N1L8_9PEZI|nr:hypothetical protein QBC46DRAFT_267321 [Diplogelasinospora grovesii]
MSRFFRPAKTILSSPRIAAQAQTGQPIFFHRVKFRKKTKGIFTRLVHYSLISYGCFTIYKAVVLLPLARALEEAEKNDPTSQDELDELDSLFIPFPLTTRMLEPQPYSGSDPEWREFIKIAKNKELQTKIRQDIANIVLRASSNNPIIKMRCGKDMKIRRHWMDIDYPYKAPPEYERSGILITETIEWATKPVDSAIVKLTNRILWPQPLFLSVWAVGTAMMKQSMAGAARYLGFEVEESASFPNGPVPGSPSPIPPTHSTEIQKALQRIRQQATKRPEEVSDPSAMASAESAPSSGASSPTGKAAKGSEPSSTAAEDAAKSPQSSKEKFPGEEKVRSMIGSGPWHEFKKKYTQTWKPIRNDPPRGCVAVSGLVELETSKAWVVIDVFAWYNPKTKGFDERSMWMALRRLQYKQQSPMR